MSRRVRRKFKMVGRRNASKTGGGKGLREYVNEPRKKSKIRLGYAIFDTFKKKKKKKKRNSRHCEIEYVTPMYGGTEHQ